MSGTHLRREFTSDIGCKLVDDVGIEVARRINVTENDRKSFRRTELLGSYVGHTESVAARRG